MNRNFSSALGGAEHRPDRYAVLQLVEDAVDDPVALVALLHKDSEEVLAGVEGLAADLLHVLADGNKPEILVAGDGPLPHLRNGLGRVRVIAVFVGQAVDPEDRILLPAVELIELHQPVVRRFILKLVLGEGGEAEVKG